MTSTTPRTGADEGAHRPAVAAAVVRRDGTAEVRTDGSWHPLWAGDATSARREVVEHVRSEVARTHGVAVRLEVTGPQGREDLLVHPDGRVDVVAGPGGGATASRGAGRRAPDDVWGSSGLSGPVDDVGPGRGSSPEPEREREPERTSQPEPEPEQQSDPGGQHDPGDQPGTEPRRAAIVAAGPPAARAPASTVAPSARPTLEDLQAGMPAPGPSPARTGWRALVRRSTGGLVAPGPGPAELALRQSVASVQRSLDGPRTVVVVNPKGGAHKTTASLLLAATFGTHRGGSTLAWDNNETRGTLGWRAARAAHSRTAVDLLADLDRFDDVTSARVGDLDDYVRAQGDAQFDVLASDEDAASAALVDAEAFRRLHASLARFYRVIVVDTGNNMRASNWRAAVEAADQLVVVSTLREDTAQSAAWLADGLAAAGHAEAVRSAVTVLSAPSVAADADVRRRVHEHFSRLTRVVLEVPHDDALSGGGPLAHDRLSPRTRRAWLEVASAVAEGL